MPVNAYLQHLLDDVLGFFDCSGKRRIVFPLIPPGARSAVIASWFLKTPSRILYVASNQERMDEVFEELIFYLKFDQFISPDCPVIVLPPREGTPDDFKEVGIRPNDEWVFFYNKLLDHLQEKKPFILVTCPEALCLDYLIPDTPQKMKLELGFGDKLSFEQLGHMLY